MPVQCWPTVCDAGPTLNQPLESVLCLFNVGLRETEQSRVYDRWSIVGAYCRNFVITGTKTPVIKGSMTCDHVIEQRSPVASPSDTLQWLTHWKLQTVQDVETVPSWIRVIV